MKIPTTVFLVEDEPLITATIKGILHKSGYLVLGEQDNVPDAYNEILKLKPELVLIDIQLYGNLDGVDLALLLDEQNVPYFYLSSLADPITSIRIKDTSPISFIHKPFTVSGLKNKIQEAWNSYLQRESA
ncbi:MAG: response regulator [Gilvibacter sp.]